MGKKSVAPKKGSDIEDIRKQRLKVGASVVLIGLAVVIAWFRLTSQTTAEVADINRVFMCADGAWGFIGWAISEMPEAQKRGSSSAPGICLRNSGANSPNTVEV